MANKRNMAQSKTVVPEKGRVEAIDWYSLYIYAVALITILICLFSMVAIVRGVVDAVWPDPGYFDPYNVPKDGKLSVDEIKQNFIDQNRRSALKSIVTSFATLLVAGPLYLYHWRLAKRRRENS
jgi:ABC-type Fe3+ transport system permease subunit